VVDDAISEFFKSVGVTSGDQVFKPPFTFSLILLVIIKSQAESSLSTFQPLRFPTIPLRSAPTQRHIVALTLYASLLKNDLGARDGCAVSLAYLLQVGVEETLDARFYAWSLLGEQVPSRCHALRSCARARFLVVACEVGGLRWFRWWCKT
jgi:hypothetical protein